jgi:hypothetical protein
LAYSYNNKIIMSDIEKGEKFGAPVYEDADGAVHGESFAIGDTFYAKLQRIAGKLGVEQRGIERVPESERTDTSLLKVATLVRRLIPKQ